MKKLLLATTMLVGTAGFAAAEVTLSGDARMGIVNDGTDTTFTSRARVAFGLSGETDGGLSFGASFRADNAAGAAAGTAGSVFISGAFGKLSVGDVDGAALAATGDLGGVGFTGLGDLNEMQYVSRLSNGINATTELALELGEIGFGPYSIGYSVDTGLSSLPRILYSYTAGDFTAYASVAHSESATVTLDDVSVSRAFASIGAGDITLGTGLSLSGPIDTSLTEIAVGGSYVSGGLMIAAGYEQAKLSISGPLAEFLGVDGEATLGHATLALGYETGNIAAKLVYGRAGQDLADLVVDENQYGASVTGTFDATSVTAFVRNDFFDDTHFGVGAKYSLGTGATLAAGYARTQDADGSFDLGLNLSF